MSFSELDILTQFSFECVAPILVDVGAHHGVFSHTFARRGWRVIAFEPEVNNYAAFQRNLANFDKVICIKKAVADTTGKKVSFYVSDEHFGIHALKPFHETHRLAYEVETVRLDDALRGLQIPQVTLLKIDIEGADFLALRTFDFAQYQPELAIVEFMDERSLSNFDYTHHDVVAYMDKRGYTTFVSEWEPIKEFARENMVGEPHVWVQCVPYPLDHEPAWGNLIFVPRDREDKFRTTLQKYLKHVRRWDKLLTLRNVIKKIPGAQELYKLIRGI